LGVGSTSIGALADSDFLSSGCTPREKLRFPGTDILSATLIAHFALRFRRRNQLTAATTAETKMSVLKPTNIRVFSSFTKAATTMAEAIGRRKNAIAWPTNLQPVASWSFSVPLGREQNALSGHE